jgi:uncharacterized iron-regulated protein
MLRRQFLDSSGDRDPVRAITKRDGRNASEARSCRVFGYDPAMRRPQIAYLLVVAFGIIALALQLPAQDRAAAGAVDLNAPIAIEKLIPQLAAKRVVFVGEMHERYDHHLNQLEIIKGLHDLDANIAIGVEYFQQPFQQFVDDYIDGRISEDEFLRRTEYFERWGYDYRLYAPIFRYAREQRIPVRALNVPSALVSEVAKTGIAALPEKDRAYLPKQIEPADEAYRNRLRAAFEQHPFSGREAFDHFVEAQLVWDEGMAESAAAYLSANPGRRMVILCGVGHVEFGSGIPKRLERRTHVTYTIVINSGEEIDPHIADYLLLSEKKDLPPAGVLGVMLEDKGGEVHIVALQQGGAAEKAGLRKGDVLLAINAQPVKTAADSRVELWNKTPGERVHIKLRRKGHLGRASELDLEVELAAAPNLPDDVSAEPSSK